MQELRYIDLISTLTALTKKNVLIWQKDIISQMGFYCFSGGQKFLIDKYYSTIENKPISCLNLTIFADMDSEKVLDEINRCPTMIGDELMDFNLLNELYKQAEGQYNKHLQNTKIPIITNITESLQKQLVAN